MFIYYNEGDILVKLTDDIKATMQMGIVYYLATSSKGGMPNVVPIKACKLLDDETILISDQFFNKTLKNMQENPHIALTYWSDKGGFQIKGTVTIHQSGKVFEDDVAWVKGFAPNLKPKSAVVVKITDVYAVKGGPDAGKKIL